MILLGSPITESQRQEHIGHSLDTGLPFLRPTHPISDSINVVGYGPSLNETWQQIINKKFGDHAVMSTSGAYDLLLRHGVYSDYYVVIDPSRSTVDLLKTPLRDTMFIMATCCHPDWWKKLEGHNVRLFHAAQGDEPARPETMVYGGSTVAQRAVHVAAVMGYRRFNMFGMDCSFTDSRHAGAHTGDIQPVTTVIYNDKEFKTTPQLIQSALEMEQELKRGDATFTFYGDGLMQEIAKTIQKGKR